MEDGLSLLENRHQERGKIGDKNEKQTTILKNKISIQQIVFIYRDLEKLQ